MSILSRILIGPNAPWRYRYNCWVRWLILPLFKLVWLILKLVALPFKPLWRKLEPKREKVAEKCAPVKAKMGTLWAKLYWVRKIFGWLIWLVGQCIRWAVNLICVLILMILFGGTGILVKHLVVPLANKFDVPLSVERFDLYPLKGYLHIERLRIDNPTSFIEHDAEVYQEHPLVEIGLFELDFDMSTLFSGDEYVVENLELTGLRALYAFDCDTTNVDALIAQIQGKPQLPAEEASSEEEATPEPQAQPEPEAPAPEPAPAPEAPAQEETPPAEAAPAEEEKQVRIRIAHLNFEDNWVSLRNGNLYVPLAVSLPLPPLECENMDNYTLQEWIDSIVSKLKTAYDVIASGVGNALELIGDGLGAGVEVLGDFAGAAGEVLGDIGASAAEIATETGAAVMEGAKDLAEGVGTAVGDVFSSGASKLGGLFSLGGDEEEKATETEK